MSVLILDDNLEKIQQILSKEAEFFEHRNFQVCRDVSAAVASFYTLAPEFAFVDFDLGVGLEPGDVFLTRVMDYPKASNTVFVLTSFSPEARRQMGRMLHAKGLTHRVWRGI